MKAPFFFGFILLLIALSYLSINSYSNKTEMLERLHNLKYKTGILDYYKSMPSPISEPNAIRKKITIKLVGSELLYADDMFFLAGLDKEMFLAKANSSTKVSLGYSDREGSAVKNLYDIKIDGESLVDKSTIEWRLQLERITGILLGIAFGLYGALLLWKRLSKFEYSKLKRQ